MINLVEHGTGVLLPVCARPGSKKNEIRGEQDEALKVCVTQVPEKGKANKALIDLLAKTLHLKKSQLELFQGETSSKKIFRVSDITVQELQQKIAPFTNDDAS